MFQHVAVHYPIMVEEGDLLGFTMEEMACPIPYTFDAFHQGADIVAMATDFQFPLVGHMYHFASRFFEKKFSIAVDVEPARKFTAP